jgi:hypothetical protein
MDRAGADQRVGPGRPTLIDPRSSGDPPVPRYPQLSDPNWLVLTRATGLYASAIARVLGCAESTVFRAMRRHEVA